MKSIVEKAWRWIESVIRFVLCRVLKRKLSEDSLTGFYQFVKFGIVGVSNTVVSYVVYLITFFLLQKANLFPNTDYLIAQLFGFLLSVLWSFYWNRKFVFQAEGDPVPWFRALLKTYVSYAFTGLFLNSVLAVVWVEWLHISKLIAPIFNLLLSVPINFLLNKFWAFRK